MQDWAWDSCAHRESDLWCRIRIQFIEISKHKRKIKKTNKRVKEIEVEVSELIKDAKLKQELIDVAMLKKGKR